MNLHDDAPKDYHELAERIVSLQANKLLGPEIEFAICLYPDQSFSAKIITPTKKFPFPDKNRSVLRGKIIINA